MSVLNSMELIIDAKSQNEKFARSTVAAFFAQLNPTLEQIEDIKTAVSEAVTNCIVHAYKSEQSGKIHIICQLTSNNLHIEIIDFGKGIENVEQAMQPFFTTVNNGERSGMGFTVMQAFCDAVEVTSTNGKTTVKLDKNIV